MFYAIIGSETVRIARTTRNPSNMVKPVGLLLIRMKKQGSECIRIDWLLKKIFGKHFKVFQKFANTADKPIKFFSLYLYLCMCIFHVCMYICVFYVV